MDDLPAEPLNDFQQTLVTSYLSLAQKLGLEAWRRACVSPLPSLPDPEKYEFVGVAYTGLIQASIAFDPTWRPDSDDGSYDPLLGFANRARTRINGAIKDWQRQLDHLPKRQRKIYRELGEKGYHSGRKIEDLAQELNLPEQKIRAIIHAAEEQAVELDALAVTEDSEAERYQFVSLPSRDIEGSAIMSAAQEVAARLLQEFPPMQRRILTLRFYEHYDFTRIAMTLQVSPTIVRAEYQEALELLHERIRLALA